jgi:hypothetical protein
VKLTEVYIWTGFDQRLDIGFPGAATMFEPHFEAEKDKLAGFGHYLFIGLIMYILNSVPCHVVLAVDGTAGTISYYPIWRRSALQPIGAVC